MIIDGCSSRSEKVKSLFVGEEIYYLHGSEKIKKLMEQRLTGKDQLSWAAKVMGYDFEIHYHPGKDNRAADALSRGGEAMHFMALSTMKVMEVEDVDKRCSKMKSSL